MHNDPRGLEAHGCVGAGVGYSADHSYFSTCDDAIRPSVALQLSPPRNVTEGRRHGPHVAASERPHLAWSDADFTGVFANGSNAAPLASATFAQPGRGGRLADGRPHDVVLAYTGKEISVRFDGEAAPTLLAPVDLAALGAVDGAGEAWVGFTAATGITSIDADLVSFAFCHSVGCV